MARAVIQLIPDYFKGMDFKFLYPIIHGSYLFVSNPMKLIQEFSFLITEYRDVVIKREKNRDINYILRVLISINAIHGDVSQ